MISVLPLVMLALAAPVDVELSPRELAPGVFVLGSSQKYGAENQGWSVLKDRVILIGVPRHERIQRMFERIAQTSPKPIRAAIVLHPQSNDVESMLGLARRGLDIVVQKEGAELLRSALKKLPSNDSELVITHIREFGDEIALDDAESKILVLSQGHISGPGDAIAYLPQTQILFAGALCVHGPRAELQGTDTHRWLFSLGKLQSLGIRTVVPGRGTVGDASLLEREVRFLRELRRQVGHLIAQGRLLLDIIGEVKITPGYLVWMPYDQPIREDIEHVYRELTVPHAPFGRQKLAGDNQAPKALVLIGDSPHDPGHIELGLRHALETAGFIPFIAVDVRTLAAENLGRVQLLVILRDGAVWPNGRDKPAVSWMTPEQELAVSDFVERGGGLLALHNSTALYPSGGPFLKLVGGTYGGHGPLERFRVEVIDRTHPITQGIQSFEVADEQHTPNPDRGRVSVLLESRSAEGTTGAAGWVHQVGQGRVCYLANGHTREAQYHPEFQKLIANAARWCIAGQKGQRSER